MKTVAVIGAGISGLSAIKACLEEELLPTCFEQHGHVGGLWRYSEELLENQGAAVYSTLQTNTSKTMTCFSDFPFHPDSKTYPKHDEFYQYLQDYAKHFKLNQHVRLNTRVIKLSRSDDKWSVKYEDEAGQKTEIYDAVLICSGRYNSPIFPKIPGQDIFEGDIFHSHHYRTADCNIIRNKRVTIIGNAHTAGDIALACCGSASKVTLSLGNGTWIISRLVKPSVPLDFNLRRALNAISNRVGFLPDYILRNYANSSLDHERYNVTGVRGPSSGAMMTNDGIQAKIKDGGIIIKRHATQFKQHTVCYDDGTEEETDVIILATGYNYDFGFLDEQTSSLLTDDRGLLNLYRMVWPVNLVDKVPSIGFIGNLSIRGSAVPCIELISRWSALIFSGKRTLPTSDVMRREVVTRLEKVKEKYGEYKTITEGSPLSYQDDIANEVGCKPSFWRMLFRDIYVAWQIIFGPAFTVQYRLHGPHSWDGALTACHLAYENNRRGFTAATEQ